MNTAIYISFATPYISSITRDECFVHSPMPLDGALAYAIYWRHAFQQGSMQLTPTNGSLNGDLLEQVVYPELSRVLAKTTVGGILGDESITNEVYLVSSGFPVQKGRAFFKVGARYVELETGTLLDLKYDIQPIRKRVDPMRLMSLGIQPITKTGIVPREEIDTKRGGLKAIDNRITTWTVFDYVWYAQVLDEGLLRELLEVLKFQGMGKKRSAGFGKVVGYCIQSNNDFVAEKEVFIRPNGQYVLLRPIPYSAVMNSKTKVALTNLMVEFGCGSRPPYWNAKEVIIREGTIFNFVS